MVISGFFCCDYDSGQTRRAALHYYCDAISKVRAMKKSALPHPQDNSPALRLSIYPRQHSCAPPAASWPSSTTKNCQSPGSFHVYECSTVQSVLLIVHCIVYMMQILYAYRDATIKSKKTRIEEKYHINFDWSGLTRMNNVTDQFSDYVREVFKT